MHEESTTRVSGDPRYCSMCGPKFCSMKTTAEVRRMTRGVERE
jgi:thiamine biosynthesis protein ThiC